jgi:hypothetical protein
MLESRTNSCRACNALNLLLKSPTGSGRRSIQEGISITNDIKYQAEIVLQNANFAPDVNNSFKVDELAAGK